MFVNWFDSGVYAARQFTRSLRSWQSDELRWVGVEVLGRDLEVIGMRGVGGGVGGQCEVVGFEGWRVRGEWESVCALWCGVRGLRLFVKGGLCREDGMGECLLDVTESWVVNGLLKMGSLRWLELEIEDEDIEREGKVWFCAELEKAFNSSENDDKCVNEVKVVFIERVEAQKEAIEVEIRDRRRDVGIYSGDPEDEFSRIDL